MRDGVDNTVYVLIVSMIRGSEIKILETRNPTKIRTEVSKPCRLTVCVQLICVRKFLDMDEADVLTIYDETRKPGQQKKKVQLMPLNQSKGLDTEEEVELKYD